MLPTMLFNMLPVSLAEFVSVTMFDFLLVLFNLFSDAVAPYSYNTEHARVGRLELQSRSFCT